MDFRPNTGLTSQPLVQTPALKGITGTVEPFDTLRTALPGWTVALADLGDEVMGYCDLDRQTIWVDVNLTDHERRTTIMHEIVHAIRGDEHSDDPAVERAVEVETARRLIHPTALRAVFNLGASTHPNDIADALDIDLDVLYTRMRNLDADEQAMIRRSLAHQVPATDADHRECAIARWWVHHALPAPAPCYRRCVPSAPQPTRLRLVTRRSDVVA